MARRTAPILLALALCLGSAAPAMGLDLYQQMVVDVVKTGKLDACKYSQDQLKRAKNATPVDANAYSASFVAAVDDAIAARAQGGCDEGKQAKAQADATQAAPAGTQAPPTAPGTRSAPSTPGQAPAAPGQAQAPPTPAGEPSPAPAIVADDSIALASDATDIATDTPFPVLALAIMAALLALGALAVALARWFAWEPVWTVRMRHAAGEAGWRASSTWAEFTDFVRLGR